MSQVDPVLQRQVQNIALGCTCLHLIGLVGEVIQLSTSRNYLRGTQHGHYSFHDTFTRKTIISVIMESFLGLITCILLYVGARKKNKWLLVPFMIVMVLMQGCLVITLFMFGMLCLTGEPIIFLGMALIMFLLSLTAWMLKTTRDFYFDIGKCERRSPCSDNPEVQPYTEVNYPHQTVATSNTSDAEGNFGEQQVQPHDLQVAMPAPMAARNGPNEPPPAYTETSSPPNTALELPPSYDEAVAMEKRNIAIAT